MPGRWARAAGDLACELAGIAEAAICTAALTACGARYWLLDCPRARRTIARWRERAHQIPDPLLRALAVGKLTSERLNPEAAVLFAVTAPAGRRGELIELIVAFQVLYDYMDAVNEQPGSTPLRNGLHLHRALLDAVRPGAPTCDYYLHNPVRDDGGYAVALIERCQQIVARLPSLPAIATVLEHAVVRCGQAQSHNHALAGERPGRFVAWCRAQAPAGSSYLWWELAAAGISCLGIHALFAVAAKPRSDLAEAVSTDGAYFPAVCALSALLDSLADHHCDIGTDNHSFVAHYPTSAQAAARFSEITAEAAALQRALPQRRRHNVILAGIVAYYLSCPTVEQGFPGPVARGLAASAGPMARLMRSVMRLRRRAAK